MRCALCGAPPTRESAPLGERWFCGIEHYRAGRFVARGDDVDRAAFERACAALGTDRVLALWSPGDSERVILGEKTTRLAPMRCGGVIRSGAPCSNFVGWSANRALGLCWRHAR